MKKLLGVLAFALLVPAAAQAQPIHDMGSLGFHDPSAPLGFRWWVTQRWAIDADFGVGSTDVPSIDQHLSNWVIDVGVPIRLSSWDRVHFLLRPGLIYRSQEVVTDVGPPVLTDTDHQTEWGAELETEVFLVENVSVSASEGFAVVNTSPAMGSSTTDWQTTGGNFTRLGFHVYLFGKSR